MFTVGDGLQFGKDVAELGDEEAGEIFQEIVAFELGEIFSVFADLLEAFAAFLVSKPILVAALAPVGEVLFVDGFVVEGIREDFLDFGESVQPVEEWRAHFAVEKAMVELFANCEWEAGDFADSGFHTISINRRGAETQR